VKIVFDEQVKFGGGPADLLDMPSEPGSVQAALPPFGMSCPAAWGFLRNLERTAGFPLLERGPAGGPRSGTRLTRQGRRFRATVDLDGARRIRRTSSAG
jgi:molybdate transport repressor ModE-like protein